MKRSNALALLAGAAGAALPAAGRSAQPLRLATIPIDSGAEVIYADANGAFKARGLETSIALIGNGAAIVSAVVGGAADIGYSNIISLAVAHQRGFPVRIVAPAALYNSKAPTSILMVPIGSPIKTARDCSTKTIGVSSLGSITQYSTQAWLDGNGGDAKSVRFVEMNFAEMAPALAAGRIDVGHFAEPFISDASKEARVLADSYDAVAPEFLIAAYFTTAAYAAANPQIVRQFTDAIAQTAVWANGHHPESGRLLASAAKLDPGAIAGMTRATYASRLLASDLQPNVDVAARYGGLQAFRAQELLR